MPRYRRSLFIFRRDLRLDDNTGLNLALRLSEQVLPCFIFDPEQIRPHPYQSQAALKFMLQSLGELRQQFRQVGAELVFFHEPPRQVVARLCAEQQIEAVFVNRDYTPFSRRRDSQLAELCVGLGVDFHCSADALLTEPEQVLSNGLKPYQVFTAFYHKARQIPVNPPQALVAGAFLPVATTVDPADFPVSSMEIPPAGRTGALALLEQLGRHKDYQAMRDFPALSATGGLSAHLKFGTCSVREAYYAVVRQLGEDHCLLRQLYWRDFFTHIAYHYPKVFGQAFIAKYADLPWDNNDDYFAAWCAGRTGFPIVDAGIRQLNSTGFMHNRLRMIVASFLVKDLHIDWRWGERYFARHLVDYDPCVNNGNWQWAASTGCDAQPYFRIFNPWLQQQKFDPDCQYIYRWLPELRSFSPKIIHQWQRQHRGSEYPPPIVDHGLQAAIIKARFKAIGQASVNEPVP